MGREGDVREYTLFQGETTDGWPNTVTSNGLEDILAYDDVFKSINGTANAVLTATGYKPGMWQDVAAETWEPLYDVTDTLTDMGVNCALRTNAEYDEEYGNIFTSLIATRYPINAEQLAVADDVERPSYDLDELEYIFDPVNEVFDEVEREKGAFLGYPESGTEAYLQYWSDGGTDDSCLLSGNDIIEAFSEQYGLDDKEQERIHLLRNYGIEPSVSAFEDMLRDVETKYRALEAVESAYNVPVTQTAEL